MTVTVTIARQLGCGGSYLGHAVAEDLGFRCLDREIISKTAEEYNFDETELAAREERVDSFWERMLTGIVVGPPEVGYTPMTFRSATDQEIFQSETEVLKSLAAREDCVIVGRAARQVLPAKAGNIHFFLHAPLEFRVQRLQDSGRAGTAEEAANLIEISDYRRARFIHQMTGTEWALAPGYHLSLDTSSLPLAEVKDTLVAFVRARMARLKKGAPPSQS
jgi:cytidylate kinase